MITASTYWLSVGHYAELFLLSLHNSVVNSVFLPISSSSQTCESISSLLLFYS